MKTVKTFRFPILLALLWTHACPVRAEAQRPGNFVLTASNEAGRNIIRHFRRLRNVSLRMQRSVSTRGRGTGSFLTNQNGLIVSGSDVLVVNAGSNEISLLRLVRGNLRYLSKVAVDGVEPMSITRSNDLVYVVSNGDSTTPSNVNGYRLSGNRLTPIAGATALLSSSDAGPAQISFSPGGDALVVSERNTDRLSVFSVDRITGLLGERQSFTSSGQQSFGFEFSNRGFLVVSEAFQGKADTSCRQSGSSYAAVDDTNGVLLRIRSECICHPLSEPRGIRGKPS